ncbi:SpvB/TcaC N-terminal domain-containing protein [Baaleninema sp.]|uniref:SpvB/TcaC N-terminal domain-containing protein n=1 Tax=Baaleninema sp. TaxID=3101197 RepID=UPI003CFDC173
MPQTRSKIEIPSVQLPKGGGSIKAIGETFQATPFTGSGSFSLPFETPAARGLEPDLKLIYNSGGSQGIFGLGFNFSVPNISRRTEKRLPNYSEKDEFVLSNAEYLVPALVQQEDGWTLEEFTRTDEEDAQTYGVQRYRTRTEGRFLRIERWTREVDSDSYWRVVTPDGIVNVYGRSPSAKIANPENPRQVFTWLLEETKDVNGNKICYFYKSEDNANVETHLFENNRSKPSQKYLQRIQYGNFFDSQGNEQYSFSVIFDYGEYDLENLTKISIAPTGVWQPRRDPFSDYRAGFEIRTHRLCRNILVFHHFEAELGVRDSLVRAFKLSYDESPVLSFLQKVEQVGYRRNFDGSYAAKSLPPVSFQYSSYDPLAHQFQPLSVEQQNSLPGQFDEDDYQLLDLYGEGISGVLFDRNGTTMYWRPQGAGQYGLPEVLPAFPIERNHPGSPLNYSITAGLWTWLNVRSHHRSGFYQLASEDSWEGWKDFESVPFDRLNSEAEFSDVTGNGFPDILIFEEERVKVYPGVRQAGHLPAITALRNADLPMREATVPADEMLVLADMCGDGLSDRVRIRNGRVTYWPNLGYGKFGNAIEIENSPIFDETFDASRLFLADIDGSGTSDLIYVRSRQIDVYFNQSGNRLSEPIQIPLPSPYHPLCRVQLADVLGNGTTCFVFSYGTQEIQHQFYDFTGGIKPHLLTEIDNHRGALTRIQYASSTKFYLRDRQLGNPWLTQLPFPVQVVEKTETLDLIAQSKQVQCYAYHHGGYDFREREFAGFGLVERWDSQGFEQFGEDREFELLESDLYVPPIHTKTWYHTGLAEREDTLSRQFAQEYYRGDKNALELEDSQFETPEGETRIFQDAYRALRGKVLREEVYADDDRPGVSDRPYSVKEYAYNLRLIQPIETQRYSVYFALDREAITYQYDRNPDDPRIRHQFYLEYDAYGNVLRSATIAYGRRENGHPDPQQTQGIYTYQTFLNFTENRYRLGLPTEYQTFELGGLSQSGYLTGEDIENSYPKPEETALDFDRVITGVGTRLIGWKQYRYWNDAQTEILPVGEAGWRGLLGYTATAVGSRGQIESLFNAFDPNRLHEKLLSTDSDGGGFRSQRRTASDRIYYFDSGITAYYGDSTQFFQPIRFVDQFGTETIASYDSYYLSIVATEAKLSDTQSLTNRVELDYRTLKPSVAIDINNNTTEYLYDELGNVQVVSRYGIENGVRRGDLPIQNYSIVSKASLEEILDNPETYIQTATSFFCYDLLAWERERQPVYAVNLHRDRYLSDDENSSLQIMLDYSDGFGRSLQKKRKAEPGEALIVNGDGTASTVESENRWITSGRTVYNNKGAVVKQYEPFYSASPRYQPERVLTEYGVTAIRHYDPLGRVYRVDLPKGYLTRTQYSAWSVVREDANDTILESSYYQESNDRLSPDAQDALDKAAQHANTVTEERLDAWGRAFWVLEYVDLDREPLQSYTQFDILGNRIRLQDPRLRSRDLFNFEVDYNMAGQPLKQVGVDNGTHWVLYNAGGDAIQRWDSRGFHISSHYDALSRPIATWVDGNGLNHQVERIVYGEENDPDGDRNLRGNIITHFDRAGRLDFSLYGIDGQWLQTQRQFREEYETEPNWSDTVTLSDETLTISRQFDALTRLVQTVYPDGRQVSNSYHESGRLSGISLQDRDGEQSIISEIQYNPRNQRERLVYGNGTISTYEYDLQTFELVTLQSRRTGDNRRLQDVEYTYDPSGNITRIRDRSQEAIFSNNQLVEPLQDYTYDALYQLRSASGREHPGLYGNRTESELPDYAQFLNVSPNINDRQAVQNYRRRFTYDVAGNLTRIQHLANGNSFTRDILISETSNRFIYRDRDESSTYDANGNLVYLDSLPALVWDFGNQLAAVDVVQRNTGTSDREYYVYDADGQRVRKIYERLVSGQIEIDETFYFGEYEIKRTRRGNRVTQERTTVTVSDGQERVAIAHRWTVLPFGQNRNPQLRFQLGNHQGSVSLELDDNSNVITYEEYYPFGGTALIAGQNQQEVERKRYRYGGRERDSVTQFYSYGTRYYVPWLGRWLSPDLAGPVDGLNLYQFVRNNPVRYTDDNGFRTVSPGIARQVAFFEGQSRAISRGIPNGLVRRRIDFFEGINRETARRGIPPGLVSQRVAQFERLREIPSGLVSQRVAQFERLAQEGSSRGIQAGLVNQRRGQIERRQEIPSGLVSRRVGQFERRIQQSSEDRTANSASVRLQTRGFSDDIASKFDRSESSSGGSFTISLNTDMKTAILIAVGILIAIELHTQRQELMRSQLRSRLHRFRDLNNEIRRFDRSQLKPSDRDDDNNDVRSENNDDNPVLDDRLVGGVQVSELQEPLDSDADVSDEKQEQEDVEEEVMQASASEAERRRHNTI